MTFTEIHPSIYKKIEPKFFQRHFDMFQKCYKDIWKNFLHFFEALQNELKKKLGFQKILMGARWQAW